MKLALKAKVYGNYKEVLEDKNIDAVLVATPLSAHYKIVMDAFDAGKHVFCEKSIGYTMEECYHIYQKHRSTGKIFFTGQQRLFDPRYIKAMEMIHAVRSAKSTEFILSGTGMATGDVLFLHQVWSV